MPKYEPKLTEEQFEGLHEAVDKARKGSKELKIEKLALENLLHDHSQLWTRLGEA